MKEKNKCKQLSWYLQIVFLYGPLKTAKAFDEL